MTAAIGSTVLNAALLKWGMNRKAAFFTTLYSFALFNYFAIGWVVKKSSAAAASSPQKTTKRKVPRGGALLDDASSRTRLLLDSRRHAEGSSTSILVGLTRVHPPLLQQITLES
jgi:hypothetical protein